MLLRRELQQVLVKLSIEIIVYTVENFIEANTVIACVCVRALREFDFNAQQHAF